MTTVAPTDGELAAAARLGDMDSFGALYRRHFPAIYDFLVRMTRHRELAGDLAQDTFVRAMQKLDQLEEPDRFRAWIYAIARTQALNRMEREGRSMPSDPTPSDEAPGPLLTAIDPDRFSDPEEAARAADVADLVWEAAASLDERTRTVLDLTLRHDLSSPEIAEVLGVTKGNASVMVNRMKERAGAAIATYLLIKTGDCQDLAAIVSGSSFPPVDDTLRRSVDGHADGCEVCADHKRRVAAPPQVMAAYAATAPPEGLADTIWEGIAERWASEGPSSAGGRVLIRAAAVVGAFLLISTLGVAGAVELGNPVIDPAEVLAASSTTSSTSTSTTTSTTTTSTSTTTTSTTTVPTTTTTVARTPTTTGTRSTPPPTPAPPPPTPPPPDTTTTIFNPPPVVRITLPTDGEVLPGSLAPDLTATVTDDTDPDPEIVWTVNGVVVATGRQNFGVNLSAGCALGPDTLVATATDADGAVGTDTITVDC